MTAPTEAPRQIVIVGASLAGLSAAHALRDVGYGGRIILIGDEHEPPYDRPPLSKQVLRGLYSADTSLPQRADLDATFRLGVGALGLDTLAHRIYLSDGTQIVYDRLLIATGTRARPWPNGAEAASSNVYTLRGHADAEHLARGLAGKPRRVLIIGGGFIGCEIASCCRDLGLDVTLAVRGTLPLAHALGSVTAAFMRDVIRDRGVDLRLETEVARFQADADSRVVAAILRNGQRIEADCVVAALGALRNTEWLAGAGLAVSLKGVRVDTHCRVLTATRAVVPDVFAAGDVAHWPSAIYGNRLLAVEHWGNAVAQAETAARNMVAGEAGLIPYDHLPDFWSQQFGLNIKLVGLPTGADQFAVVQGSLRDRRFIGVYGAQGRTVAAVSVDSARWLPAYRAAVAEAPPFPPIVGALDQADIRPQPLAQVVS